MPVDIRVLVMESFVYIQIYKVRVECLKDFYDCQTRVEANIRLCKCQVIFITFSLGKDIENLTFNEVIFM
jgi:hypothetical protein